MSMSQRRKYNKGFCSTSVIKFGLSLGLLKHEVNTRDFIFQGIRRWVVINLVTLIHGYLHLISLVIVVGYQEKRSFQETQVMETHVSKKPRFSRNPGYGNSRIHRRTFKTESHKPSCEIIPNTQDHAKNALFQ